MVSNYFLGMDNIPQNDYKGKSQKELAQIAIAKTDQELNTKKFNRNTNIIDATALGMFVGNTLLNNGAAASTLLAITDICPYIGVFGLDKILRNKNEKYKKFRQDNPMSTTFGLIGGGYLLSSLTRIFFQNRGRDFRTFFAIQQFYNKVSNFLKENPVSKKVSEIYNNHFPKGGKEFFKSAGFKISNCKEFLRTNNIARLFLNYVPLILFIGNFIRNDSFRMKRQEKAQENYQKLSIMNKTGQL